MDSGKDVYTKDNPRVMHLGLIFAALFVFLVGALGYRQLYMHDYYMKRSDRQSLRRVIKAAARGDILDRNSTILVTNKPRYSAVIYFNDINDEIRKKASQIRAERRAALARGEKLPDPLPPSAGLARAYVLKKYTDMVNGILGTNYQYSVKDFERHAWARRLLPYPLLKDLTDKEHAILAEKLPPDSPVQIYTSSSRYYPYAETAAHVLGYVTSNFDNVDPAGIPGEDLRTYSYASERGKSGVEASFDEHLSGTNGAKIWLVDHMGYQYESIVDIPSRKGKNLTLSLDIVLQETLESAFGDRKGAGVLLDIKTGEVLAMASRPGYDLNSLTPFITHAVSDEITARGAWLNRATQGLYPPGSTFKIVTAIAAMREGAIIPETVITCDGALKIGYRMYPCNNRWGHGNLDLVGALAKSCNVYFYQAGLDTKITAIHDTAQMLGLNSDTGIELGENSWRRTIVPDPEYKRARRAYEGGWSMGDTANTSIGQGYLLQTPIQIACMTASVAARRTRTRASILHDPKRKTDMDYHGAKSLPISDKNYAKLVEGMIAAVERGTCKRAAIEYAQVAAKSGTAQVNVRGKKLALAWMVAFAPADKPEVAIAVVVEGEEPGDAAGGRTAGPIVHEALKKYFERRPAQ